MKPFVSAVMVILSILILVEFVQADWDYRPVLQSSYNPVTWVTETRIKVIPTPSWLPSKEKKSIVGGFPAKHLVAMILEIPLLIILGMKISKAMSGGGKKKKEGGGGGEH